MKKQVLIACAALCLAGCATYDRDEGAPGEDSDVIYGPEAGDTRGPGGLDYPKGTYDEGAPVPPPVMPPSGNRFRNPEPTPSHPTEAVPPQ